VLFVQHLLNTESAAIYSPAHRGKELSVRIQFEGINSADLDLIRKGYQLDVHCSVNQMPWTFMFG